MAVSLDAAHATGKVHGALHPGKIFVTDDATQLVGGPGSAAPYIAPEVASGGAASPLSDQFSFAAIAFEWMFGRPITGPAERHVDVRTTAGIDRAALSKAFTRALAPEPSRRFASCREFCEALAASVVPALPLVAADEDGDTVEPFVPEMAPIPDLPITAEESMLTAAQPDLDSITPGLSPPPPAMASWQPSAVRTHHQPAARFTGVALIFATLVGAVFGFAAGYMAIPRALQQAPMANAVPAGTESAVRSEPAAPGAPPSGTVAPKAPTPAPKAPAAPEAPTRIGRLLVRSSPSGASVQVDGVTRGETPLALRDLDLGAKEIIVARRGYLPESRRVVLTNARPSRSVEVRLSTAAAASASAAAGRSGAISPKPAVSTGTLAVESRPPGAAVAINGKPSGKTPLTINDLPPGEYRVTLTLAGYRDFATTVRVVAGERARAAASLTAQEQE